MKIGREKTIALFVGTCMVLTLCMTGFVTTADATTTIEITEYISQGDLDSYSISIPEGPEVEIKLIWDEPKNDMIDLDFYVLGYAPGDPLYQGIGATLRNPEIAYLHDDPSSLDILIYAYYVPGDSVEYRLEVTCGSNLEPEPYAEPGGLNVGALTSFHHVSRAGIDHSGFKSANNWIFESNPLRQAIMPSAWTNFWSSPLYWGSEWDGPAYYAGDPLLVGAMAYSWSMAEYTRDEAVAEMEALNVYYMIDGIPLENLAHVTEKQVRPDNINNEWYYRFDAAIFGPGELYSVLPDRENGLHTLEGYAYGDFRWFIGDFYLLW